MTIQTHEERINSNMVRGINMKDEEKLYKGNGVLYSTIMSPPENLDALKDLEGRAEDVMLVSYPKCGCNWMLGVLRKIMATCGFTVPEMHPLIEFHSPDVQKIVAQMPSRWLLATHLHHDHIPVSFKTNKSKTLVVFRNPKDTVVSYYHFINNNPTLPKVSWDKFFSDFMSGEVGYGSYFHYSLPWEKHMDDPNVMIVTYEELKENLVEGIKKVVDFFSFTLTDEQVKMIAGKSTFSVMQSNTSYGKMTKILFRKGEVGDWKNHFSEAQSKQMDEEFKKKLSGTRLGAKLKYEQYCQ